MSRKYPYRQPPFSAELRPDPGPYSSSDGRHISLDHDFYRPPRESFSSSYPSSSSSRDSAQWSQDGALSILSSCGLEPSDLSLLAELPEDVLTVESLPHVLKQIKGKRGTRRPFPSNAPSVSSSSSYPPSSTCRTPVSSRTGDRDQLRSQPVQYLLNQLTSSPLPSEQVQNRWGNPRPSTSVRADPASSSSSSSMYKVDFHPRPGPSDYGKKGRATGPFSCQDRPPFGSGQRTRTCPSNFSEPRSAGYRLVPPHYEYPQWGRLQSKNSSLGSSHHTATIAVVSMPSTQEALDFHGTSPQVFPYSCSLCDITVLSERVWIKHINSTEHAEGQLSLLQRFPKWDCRIETVRRADSQSEKWKNEEKPTQPQTANQSQKLQPNKQPQKKMSEKGKVVCVKFPAQSVDETYLRKLTEPFGKIIKILMFPSLAFVELGSVDQAKDLVKFHVNYPPTVNGEQMEFSISTTFNFLQSSRVVSFTPAPTGDHGRSELMTIIKRFGPPLYTLFLPSIAFVEMKCAPDAQKLVDYYSSNTLRINSDLVKVSFSGEYRSLMRVASAKRYEEETPLSSRSREEEEERETKRMRSSGKDGVEERREDGGESSRDQRTRSRSRDKPSRETRARTRSKSRTRDKPREKPSRERGESRSRPRSIHKSSSTYRENTVEPEKTEEPDTESKTDAEPAPVSESKPETAEKAQTEDKAESSAEESDIEGMEVIGEDGEILEVEEEESNCPAERTDSPEEDKEKEVKDGETEEREEVPETTKETEVTAETQMEDDKEEPDFPVDLENCITLDELDDAESEVQESRGEPEDFVEMSNSSEVTIAANSNGLTKRWDVQSDWDQETRSDQKCLSQRSRSEEGSKSRTSNRNETCRKPEGRKESSKTPEKESESKKSSDNESVPRKTPEKQLVNGNHTEKELTTRNTSEKTCRTIADKGFKGLPKTSPENEKLKRKGTNERDPVPEKIPKVEQVVDDASEKEREELCEEEASDEQTPQTEEGTSEPAVQDSRKSAHQPDSTADPPEPQTQQKPSPADADWRQDSDEPGPAGGAAEPERPPRPVGTEFVRPVVGYFCNLCQVIYADEDKAKVQHCSSLAHYRKYQEKTGKDPWTS